MKAQKDQTTSEKKFSFKTAVMTVETLVIFVAIGFVAGWYVHSNYAADTQAQIEKTTAKILKSVPVSQAAVAPKE
jgi:ABC-type phosphate transport system permease subunit